MYKFKTLDENAFFKAIEEKDYSRLKTSIISSIRNNPTFIVMENEKYTEAKIAMKILKEKLPEMFMDYTVLEFEDAFNEDEKEKWNNEYFLRQTFLLGENFCMERYDHLRKIGKELANKKDGNFINPQAQEQEGAIELERKSNLKKRLPKPAPLLMLGGVILALIVLVVMIAVIK